MSMLEDMISVITPVYNVEEKYFRELLASLKAQSLCYDEWVIIDDGSKQDVKDFLKEVATGDLRIKIVTHNENLGLPAARNTGIKNARGKYLFFIDGDDLIHSTALEKLVYTLEFNPQLDFVNSYVKGFGSQEYEWKGGFHDGEAFLKENRNTSCFMSRRAVFDSLLFDESLKEGCEDWDFWLHAASKGIWGYTLPEFLFYYRRCDNVKKWDTLASKIKLEEIGNRLESKYGGILKEKGFPEKALKQNDFEPIDEMVAGHVNACSNVQGTNVLFLIPWMEIGGADKFNLELARGLKSKGWSITFVCTEKGENQWLGEFKKISEDIFCLWHYVARSGYYNVIDRLIIARETRLVFLSNSMYGYYLLPYLRQKHQNLPVVDYLHCEEENWYNGGYPMFSIVFRKFLSKTIVTSGHLREWVIARGKDRSSLDVVYVNIDSSRVKRNAEKGKALRNTLNVSDNTALIVFAGRLTPQKQPDVLYKALEKLYSVNRNFYCVIIGEGPEKKSLLEDINRGNVGGNIFYAGGLANEEVLAYMDAADIFFLPSAYEGVALSIYEAMSKEIAIVGANVGGQQELVNNDCGILVQRSTVDDESDRYAAILNEYILDLDNTRQIGKYCRERIVEHFDIGLMIAKMSGIFTSVIDNHQRVQIEPGREYLVVLNNLLAISEENDRLSRKLENPWTNFLNTEGKLYRLARKVYQPFKRLVNYRG